MVARSSQLRRLMSIGSVMQGLEMTNAKQARQAHCISSAARRSSRPHPEEYRKSAVADLRVRLEGWGSARAGPCFETHRSAAAVAEMNVLGSRCDAPQHEDREEGRAGPLVRHHPLARGATINYSP